MRWAWLALWSLSLPAWAEPRALTYEEALTGALESNPSLRRARLDRDAAAASVRTSQGQFDPVLGVDGSWRQSRSKGFFQGFPFDSESKSWNLGTNVRGSIGSGTSYALNAGVDRNFSSFVTNFGGVGSNEQIQDAYTSNLNVSLTQQLLKGFRTSFNIQNITRARQGLTTSELSLEKARQDALARTATAYWNWVYQHRLESIARDSEATAAEALRIGRLKVEAGDLAPVEKTRLEAAFVQSQAAALDASNAAQRAADDLLLLIGWEPGLEVMPASKPGEVGVVELDGDAAAEVALAQNLDLAIARASLEAAELDVANARHARLPSLAATGSTGIGAQDESVGAAVTGIFDEDAFPFVSLGGSFSMPLGNRSARGEAERVAVTEVQRRNAVVELESSVASQVRHQVRVLESSRRRVELADANLRLAVETLSAEEALEQAGRAIQKDVLESRTGVDRARADAAKARTDFRLAQVELLRLQGQLTQDES
jgi:outer membrane protein TolC